jgi:hypothetical protein
VLVGVSIQIGNTLRRVVKGYGSNVNLDSLEAE